MKLEHSFTVPVPVAVAWDVLRDVERIAPCMPGATIDSVDGDSFTGRVKVKVGPITVTYGGEASFVQLDEAAHVAVLEAAGKESRGSGTARATVRATLTERDGATAVEMVTDLAITGKPAQFGRGVMADIGAKLVQQFADCLSEQLSGGSDEEVGGRQEVPAGEPPEVVRTAAVGGSVRPPSPAQPPSGTPRPQARTEPEAIDLFDVAGGAVGKRMAPLAAGAALLALIIWLIRRR